MLGEHPVRVYLVSVPVLAASVLVLALSLGEHFLDLEVYRLGVRTWLSGGDLYGVLPTTSAGNVLPFIYPPFAALLMVPLTVTAWGVASVAVFAASLLTLAATLYVVLHRLWPSGGHTRTLAATTVLVAPSLALEPVSQTFGFGQINLVLMAMVAADCLVARPRWPRGALVGLAAAIKLTPGAFVLFFLLRRDHRAAITVGLSAVLTRIGLDGLGFTVCWLGLSVALVLLAVPVIRRAPAPLALMTTAGVGLLVSPTSWSHHWVWIAPALLVAGVSAWRARSPLWAAVTAVLVVTFTVAPFQFLPHDDHGLERTWSPVQQVIGASYVIVTVVVVVLLSVTWRQRPPADVAEPSPESSAA